ncbi:hypothetical protein OS493_008256 [Desmophyllum pertusum]|uniref:Uncharacterized protein n=1 Tax=Desmophyllum pertusum TaxID=174260 RepID=A0A9X0A4N7_9CNID|nr:hypothetical protein OS493_008256 [Desmophyllum pertusum]
MASVKRCPNVYIFEEDYRRIKELVLLRPTEETGGNLYGLWTNDDEPVLHIVTGQGREIKQTRQDPSSAENADSVAVKLNNLEVALCKRFQLSYMGKWQYKRRSVQKDMAIIETAGGQSSLRERVNMHDFVLIMADYDDSSKRLKLSPYLLSQFSIVTKGNYANLSGESVFRKDDDIGKLVDALTEKGGLKEGESKQPTDENPDENETGAPLTDHLSTDVDMTEEKPSRDDPANNDGLPAYQSGAGIVMPRLQTDFVCNQRDFKVHISQEDEEMMTELVLRYPDVETGGDLFGLWTTEGDVMIHIVLGPGQECKRTGTSFYQDIPYLQRNGELLTQNYMLCHIGEWHSHHQLRLFQPSQGDSSTVIRNYPRGTCGFLLIIANIVSRSEVTLSPYLYTANSSYRFDQKGTLVPLRYNNAFKKMR